MLITVINNFYRAENCEVFETSVYLASRYGLSKWDVFMMQLDWLMTESGLATHFNNYYNNNMIIMLRFVIIIIIFSFSADEVKKRVSHYKMMDKLLSQPQKVYVQYSTCTVHVHVRYMYGTCTCTVHV